MTNVNLPQILSLNLHSWAGRSRSVNVRRRRRLMGMESLEGRRMMAVFNVSSPFDGVPGDLRSAIVQSNLLPGPDLIQFSVNNVQLTLGEILITDAVVVDGTTAPIGQVNIRAAANARIFQVDNGLAAQAAVEMTHLVLRDGQANDGGAILNREALTLRNSVVTGNEAANGGGIANQFGRLVLHSSLVYDNLANYQGGGISNNEGALELHQTAVQVNRVQNVLGVPAIGGGIQNLGRATALLVQSQVLGNVAIAPLPGARGLGGGISVMLESSLHLIESQVTDNFAEHQGGGIFSIDNSLLRMDLNSVVSSNTAGESGGGIQAQRSIVDILDSAITNNTTELRGGGISAATDVVLNLSNSRVTGNRTDLLNPDGSGGGLFLSGYGTANGPRVQIVGSDISQNNLVAGTPPGGEFGGGISALYGTVLNMDQTTVTQNGASIAGGGIYISDKFSPHAPQVTITGSHVTTNLADVNGGGIVLAGGILNMNATTVRRNETFGRGGGIFLTGLGSLTMSSATLQDCQIVGNRADLEGGGIAAGPNLDLKIQQSQVLANATFGKGGGLYVTGLNVPAFPHVTTISDSTVSDNTARYDPAVPIPTAASGGGIYASLDAAVSIQSTTISGNLAERIGAGIMAHEASLVLNSSTLRDNRSSGSAGGAYLRNSTAELDQVTVARNDAVGDGGGLVLYSFLQNRVTITHSTISVNQADSQATGSGVGGGIFLPRSAANDIQVDVSNSILAGNFTGSILSLPHNSDLFDGAGQGGNPPVQFKYTLVGSNRDTFLLPANPDSDGNKVGSAGIPLDALLGPLAANGGSMLTMLPQPGSPAIDAGDPLFATPPLFDQRGAPFIRIDSGRTDMGSVETQSQFPGPDLDGDGDADCDDINALTQAIASGAYMPGFDMNLDGVLNILDIERWLCKAGNLNLGPNLSYRVGDANLDGFVDGSDFGLWNANKFTNNSAWCAGNFNSDGVVDGADFGLWNANKFQGAFACNPLPRGSKRCQVELPPIVDVVIAEWPIPIRDTHGQVAATPETSFRDKRITRSKKISGA